jgi:hypothetical protein
VIRRGAASVARATRIAQIALAHRVAEPARVTHQTHLPSMPDETPRTEKERNRRQAPVPLTLAVFAASVVGFMVVVAGLFALMRFLGGWR